MPRAGLRAAVLVAGLLLAHSASTHDDHHHEEEANATVDDCAQAHGGSHGSHGQWFMCSEDYEYEHFEEVTVVVLVSVTLLVEVFKHKLQHLAEHSYVTGLSNEDRAAHDLETKSLEPLWLVFFNNVTAEFTVLGILAFLLWICTYHLNIFEAVLEANKVVEDFSFPESVEDYVHTTEATHVHLFITFIMYFMVIGFSLASAQRHMASWAVSATSFHEETKCKSIRKVKFRPYNKGEWTDEFHVLRQTFLEALQHWSGRWALFDQSVGHTIQKYASLEDGGIINFLEPWFPFGHYIRINCRVLLDFVVMVQPTSLMFMILINGLEATIHRMKINFQFGLVWLGLLTTIIVLLWSATTWIIMGLKKGSYKHGKLIGSHKVMHRSWLPKLLLTMAQTCLLYICFEFSMPLAHSNFWDKHPEMAVAYAIFCPTVLPIFGWLVWGPLIAKVALSLSCGFMISDTNVHRIQAMVELHMETLSKEASSPSHKNDNAAAPAPVNL